MPDGELLLQGNHVQERSPRLSTPHLDALLKRGLTRETIEAAGLWSASAERVAELLGFNPRSGGLVLPYKNPLTGEVVLNRVRPDTPPIMNGKPAKYLSPRGAANRLYFPPNCAALLHDPSVSVCITEGEFKVLLAYQHGLFCVGLIGVYGFRGRNTHGEKGPISDLDLITWQDRGVAIIYDTD